MNEPSAMTKPSYFEDFPVGAVFEFGSVTVSEAEILLFARQFDPQVMHVDPVAAAAGATGGLIASGWHTGSLAMRMYADHILPADLPGSPFVYASNVDCSNSFYGKGTTLAVTLNATDITAATPTATPLQILTNTCYPPGTVSTGVGFSLVHDRVYAFEPSADPANPAISDLALGRKHFANHPIRLRGGGASGAFNSGNADASKSRFRRLNSVADKLGMPLARSTRASSLRVTPDHELAL